MKNRREEEREEKRREIASVEEWIEELWEMPTRDNAHAEQILNKIEELEKHITELKTEYYNI